jgi:pSer/pThr/pTyr-binding forkhead associated (FHA) protein
MAKIQVFFDGQLQGECLLDDKLEVKVGRASSNDIVIDNAAVSRLHCTLEEVNKRWLVMDANSSNGIFVNGEKVTQHILKHQDRVVIGKHTLLFDQYGADSSEEPIEEKNTEADVPDSTVFLGRDALAKMMHRSRQQQAMALALTGANRRVVPLEKAAISIGKGKQCDLRIGGLFVKQEQALVINTERGHKIIHQGGWRAMLVNGEKRKEALLRAGDVIVIAGNKISYGSL